MCKCKNIEIGSYNRQTSMKNPFTNKWVCIDTCLVQEIAELWQLGIDTIESCCGHNKNKGYIMVHKDYFPKMIRNNYEPITEWNDKALSENSNFRCFYPLIK